MFYRIIISFLIFAVLPAAALERVDFEEPSYLFHLYYDNDQLFADRDFQFAYDVIPEKFTPEAYTTQFPFSGEIVNFRGEAAAEFLFDPRRGNPSFIEGKITVKAPYVPDGQKAVFYDAQGRVLLTIFVSESSFCDDNGICNTERGEDKNSCPYDCADSAFAPPAANDGNGQLSVFLWSVYVLIGAGAAAGIWYVWRRYKERADYDKLYKKTYESNEDKDNA